MKEAAYVAKIIRAELKDKMPNTKFSVRSENFSGGDAVRITFNKSMTGPTVKEVYAIVTKYQAGHFDGMTDSYEYTNKTEGPTVKYVQVSSEYPAHVCAAVRAMNLGSASPEIYRAAYEAKLAELSA